MPSRKTNSETIPPDLKEEFLACVDDHPTIQDFIDDYRFNRNTLRNIRAGLRVHPNTINQMRAILKKYNKKKAA